MKLTASDLVYKLLTCSFLVGFISVRVDFHQLAAPNLANSAVLKMLEEEERHRGGKGKSFMESCSRYDSISRGRLGKLTCVIWTGHFHRAPWETRVLALIYLIQRPFLTFCYGEFHDNVKELWIDRKYHKTVNLPSNGFEYNWQNRPVYNCEFLEMLRHYESYVVRTLFKIKR
jgi:hypothetical protein